MNNNPQPPRIILSGPAGSGKTWTSWAIERQYHPDRVFRTHISSGFLIPKTGTPALLIIDECTCKDIIEISETMKSSKISIVFLTQDDIGDQIGSKYHVIRCMYKLPTPNPSQEGNTPHTPHGIPRMENPPAPPAQQLTAEWHTEHCDEMSDITLRNINKMVRYERERYEDRMEEVNKYEALHFMRESLKTIETRGSKAEAYRLIARTIILLQDSDL